MSAAPAAAPSAPSFPITVVTTRTSQPRTGHAQPHQGVPAAEFVAAMPRCKPLSVQRALCGLATSPTCAAGLRCGVLAGRVGRPNEIVDEAAERPRDRRESFGRPGL